MLMAKINLFKNKSGRFQQKVLPLLQTTTLYHRDDILFSEGDSAVDIYFILVGQFKLYFDCSDTIELDIPTINLKKQAFNVPFSLQYAGSYFGDEDCFKSMLSGQSEAVNIRECTAVSYEASEILTVNKHNLL